MKGIIINGICRDKEPESAELTYYGVLETGDSFVWKKQDPYLFFFASKISETLRQKAKKIVSDRFRSLDGTPLHVVHFRTERDLKEACSGADGPYYETDIESSARYLMEKGIVGRVDFGTSSFRREGKLLIFEDPVVEKSSSPIATKVLSIDIETGNKNKELYSIGLYTEGYQKVLMRSEERSDHEWTSFYPTEQDLLKAFMEEVKRLNPQVFIGWNVLNFDFDFLIRKCREHHLPFCLGVDDSELVSFRGKNNKDLIVRINGRFVLDGIPLMRQLHIKLPDYRLDTAAKILLGETKLITTSGKSKVEQIEHLFSHDKPSLSLYNLKDAQLVYDLFQKVKAIEHRLEHYYHTGIYPEKNPNAGMILDYLYIPRLHRMHYAAPNEVLPTVVSPLFEDVREVKGGLHRDVIHLSFEHFFPSVVQTFKIDPLGKMQADREPDQRIQPPRGIPFHYKSHVFPSLIEDYLLSSSKPPQKDASVASQVATDLIHSMVFSLAKGRSRFSLGGLYESMIQNATAIVLKSIQMLEEKGNNVVYADHQGCFIHPTQSNDLQETAQSLCTELNDFLKEWIQKEYGVRSYLRAVTKDVYDQIFFFHQKPVSFHKRMAQFLAIRHPSHKKEGASTGLIRHGYEVFQKEYLPVVLDLQVQVIECFFKRLDPTDCVRQFKEELLSKKKDPHLVFKKRLKKSVDAYEVNAPLHVVAARKISGDKPFYVQYVLTKEGPEPVSHQKTPIDYGYYLEKQVGPILETVLLHTAYEHLIEEVSCLESQLNLFTELINKIEKGS